MLFDNLPTDRYKTIVIDPAWPQPMILGYKRRRHQRAITLPYKTLTIEEIKTFPISQLAETGAHVYTWTTNRFLPYTFDVLKAWGVNYHLTMPLVKKSGICGANGYVFGSEFCLLGSFGKPMIKFKSMGKLNWLVTNPLKGTHSKKPQAFYDLVTSMSEGPYLDCFARQPREGWTTWGDEIDVSEKKTPPL